MPRQAKSGSLSFTTVALHWLAASGVVGMLGFGLFISVMPRGPDKVAMIQTHKSLGILVLCIVLVRLAWRLREGWPKPVATLNKVETRLARVVHWLLLIAPIIMITSGIVRSIAFARPVEVFGLPFIPKLIDERNIWLNEAAGAIHDVTAWVLIAVITLHVAGALRHHLVLRDGTLRRMLGRSVDACDRTAA